MNKRRYPSALAIVCLICVALLFAGCSRDPAVRSAQFMSKGKSFLEKHDYARAILQFQNAAQKQPQDAEPYYQMGLAYLGRGDFQQAAACFYKTIQLKPKHHDAA